MLLRRIVHFTMRGIVSRPTSSMLAEKLCGIGIEYVGELLQHVDRRGVLLAFEHANVIPVDVCTVGKFLLRQALGLSQPA